MDRLFAYGTLQHDQIITLVLNRVPESVPVELRDFERRKVRGEDFPGIFPRKNAVVDGLVFHGISPEEFQELDRYESDLYVRRKVRVNLPGGETCTAHAYIIPPENQDVLSEEPWELKHYQPNQPSENP